MNGKVRVLTCTGTRIHLFYIKNYAKKTKKKINTKKMLSTDFKNCEIKML